MAKRNSLFPRPIQPELIMVGDEISAEYPDDGGIVVSKRGIVHRIVAHGGARHLLTAEGGALAVYHPGFSSKVSFTIHMREYTHETLSMFDDPGRLTA